MTWPFPVSSRSMLKPERTETCPKCNGTSRMAVPPDMQAYKKNMAGYDQLTDTLRCDNCGGQYMYGRATGKVFMRRDGSGPCLHEYEGRKAGNCYYVYTCKHCPDKYDIDSGD